MTPNQYKKYVASKEVEASCELIRLERTNEILRIRSRRKIRKRGQNAEINITKREMKLNKLRKSPEVVHQCPVMLVGPETIMTRRIKRTEHNLQCDSETVKHLSVTDWCLPKVCDEHRELQRRRPKPRRAKQITSQNYDTEITTNFDHIDISNNTQNTDALFSTQNFEELKNSSSVSFTFSKLKENPPKTNRDDVKTTLRHKPRLKPSETAPPEDTTTSPTMDYVNSLAIRMKCNSVNVITGPYKELALTFRFLTLILNLLLLLSTPCWADLTEEQLSHLKKERAEAVEKWAPLIFNHPNERFFPSAVHSFLNNVVPREIPASERPTDPPILVPMSRSLDTRALPEGINGEDTYLIAPIDPKCKNCPLPDFLHGTKPSVEYSPPVYAVITSCLPSRKSFRNPRHIKPPSRQPRQRRFRFRKRRGRFSFRGRRKASRMGHSFIPPDRDSYVSTLPLNSFTPPMGEYPKPFTKVRKRVSQNSLFEDRDELSTEVVQVQPLISPPSTTLLPPKTRTFPSPQPDTTSTLGNSDLTTPLLKADYSEFASKEREPLADHTATEVIIISADGVAINNFTSSPGTTTSLDLEVNVSRITRNSDITEGSSLTLRQNIPTANAIQKEKTEKLKGHKFTVTYWMFYPFSQGKEVCTSRLWLVGRIFKPRLRNKCYGEVVTLNSHVGDWEHISIYFEDGLPQQMYVSTHTYGAFYQYNPRENIFVYRGKDTRLGLPLNPKYPPIIKMDGTHPVVYAALGSHGLWGSPGVHRYEHLVPLEDKTEAGTPWKAWQNIDIIDYRDPHFDRADRQWLQFYGRWGNPSNGCHKALFGSCDLANGPTGIPLKRENFPCHLPQHPTFFPKN